MEVPCGKDEYDAVAADDGDGTGVGQPRVGRRTLTVDLPHAGNGQCAIFETLGDGLEDEDAADAGEC